jgi:protein-S-isoprenylcysteine O-methyltransferase Ste14
MLGVSVGLGPYGWIVAVSWLAFVAYWAVGMRSMKRAKRTEPPGSTLLNGALLLVGFVLIILRRPRIGLLALRFAPGFPAIELVGVVLVVVGIGLAIWSRSVSGSKRSGAVRITEGQRLVRTGPYRVVRNPIYSGILLAILGMAFTSGAVGGLIGFAMAAVALWRKAQTEERHLLEEFGEPYARYQRQVKSLVPFIF